MDIYLKNIGIIKDSKIKLDGLTVITGHNNSGKTTVGRVVYSLVDAVSDISQKAENDKFYYAISEMEKALNVFSFTLYLKRVANDIENECLQIFFSEDYRASIDKEKIDKYLSDLIKEVENFEISEEPYNSLLNKFAISTTFKRKNYIENFQTEKDNVLNIFKNALYQITSDPELINYTKQSIITTLKREFHGQIQPAAYESLSSSIKVVHNGISSFCFTIENNEICDSKQPIFHSLPYNKTYFIDNPFVLDEPAFRRFSRYSDDSISFVNESRILSHGDRLRFVLNRSSSRSVFEEGIIDSRYKEIKKKIDDILPGHFTTTGGNRFYVEGNVKLRSANLATGSKMFSIIKMLLSKGEIDKHTILILDEPEAHLHPQWQNMFAEIIILLVKEIGCNILLTTHSTNFMLAIDAYMREYQISDICNFYQTTHDTSSNFVDYNCVNDSLDLIYKDFVTSLTDVKNLRNKFLDID